MIPLQAKFTAENRSHDESTVKNSLERSLVSKINQLVLFEKIMCRLGLNSLHSWIIRMKINIFRDFLLSFQPEHHRACTLSRCISIRYFLLLLLFCIARVSHCVRWFYMGESRRSHIRLLPTSSSSSHSMSRRELQNIQKQKIMHVTQQQQHRQQNSARMCKKKNLKIATLTTWNRRRRRRDNPFSTKIILLFSVCNLCCRLSRANLCVDVSSTHPLNLDEVFHEKTIYVYSCCETLNLSPSVSSRPYVQVISWGNEISWSLSKFLPVC